MTAGHPHFPFRFFSEKWKNFYSHTLTATRSILICIQSSCSGSSISLHLSSEERKAEDKTNVPFSLSPTSHFNLICRLSSPQIVSFYVTLTVVLFTPHHHWPLAGTPNYRCLVYLYPLFSLLHLSLTWGMEHQHPAFLLLLLLLCIVTAQTHYS